MFLFIVQQVHTQPLVTSASSITSIPTSAPKDTTATIKLSLSSVSLLICDDSLVWDSVFNIDMLEVGPFVGVVGQSLIIVVGESGVIGGSVAIVGHI